VGTYRVRLYQPGKSEFAGSFEVQAYQLEKVDLSIELPRTVYYRGEAIEADVVARYQYGTPLAGRAVRVQLPDGTARDGTTDAAGKYHVALETEGFGEEQALRLVAQLPQDNVAAAAVVMLAVRGFRIDLGTDRDVYLHGETIPLRATTLDAQGEPTGQALAVSVLKRVAQAGRVTEREVATEALTTDPKTGQGGASLKVDDEDGGSYVVRAAGTDRFGNPVVAERALTISGKKDATKLRILADRQTFKVGEEAAVTLHSRAAEGPALVTWEADRILAYRLVPLREGKNALSWEVAGAQFPNCTLTAARMAGTEFHEARLDLRVERDLRVTITPKAPTVGPGAPVEVEVTTTDQLGRPVAAELALALVDRALLRLYGDRLPPIGRFFYDQARAGAFATSATNTFRYQPATVPVAEAVVEEGQRALAEAADARVVADARRQAGKAASTSGTMGRAPQIQTFNGRPAVVLQDGSVTTILTAPDDATVLPGAPSSLNEPVNAGFGLVRGRAGQPGWDEQDTAGNVLLGVGASSFGGDKLGRMDAAKESDFADLAARRKLLARSAGMALAEAPAPAPTREQFVETAYWNPSVVTGPDGKARVTFPAPSALSEYRFTARGVTGADTLVGQATAELAVRKSFFVDLKRPAVLIQGDAPQFSAQLHHAGVAGTAAVRLTVYAGGRERVFPKTLELKADGVEEIRFEPFEVPDADSVRLTLSARVGETADEMTAEVPVRPWGVQAVASASGTAGDDATAFVGLPPGRAYEDLEMLVVVAPSLRRMLIELALGRDTYALDRGLAVRLPVPPETTADRAGDLLAATAALGYLKAAGGAEAPEAVRLTERVRGLVAELIPLQNEDGGWPWVGGSGGRPSDRNASARVAWALAAAEPFGLLADPKALEKAATYLAGEFAKTDAADHETRAALLHALSTRDRATFEQANALNRLRQNLPDVALAYLALTFANLDRAALADEVLGVLGPRAKSEPAAPGASPRRFWSGDGRNPWSRGPVEATALAALAFARVRPQAAELAGAADWLLAHRDGTGWRPSKAKGPALAALAAYFGGARQAEDRYRLVVTVNDAEVGRADVVGTAQGQAIRVPRRVLKDGAPNRVHFDIEGRGTFGYAVTLAGFTRDFKPDQDPANRPFVIQRRAYLAADPELDGKTLPSGFAVAPGTRPFENPVTQVALGRRARVQISAARSQPAGQPAWERDFLVLEEHLPAGATLVEGSVQSQASHFTAADGVLTFYFAPDQYPGTIRYDVHGYLPGRYRAPPPRIASAYDPGRSHLGAAGTLTVLSPGEKSTDPYRATPDELYARGKAHFDAGRLAEAATPLGELFGGYTLRDDVAKDAARMLLLAHIRHYEPKKIVQHFEVLKEKAPELVLP
ncbi:MAG TPA: alpha-2-macroglobulin family protein, partial [Isosphaeraceae bacterium]